MAEDTIGVLGVDEVVKTPINEYVDFAKFTLPLEYDTTDFMTACLLILIPGLLGLVYALFDFIKLRSIKMTTEKKLGPLDKYLSELELSIASGTPGPPVDFDEMRLQKMIQITKHIADGSKTFLMHEYMYLGIFVLIVAALFGPLINWPTMVCFLAGSFTSAFAGWFGMKTATFCNVRTAYGCWHSLSDGFSIAVRGGAVVGFFLTSIGVTNLFALVCIFNNNGVMSTFNNVTNTSRLNVFEAICGYGLGASSVALFARVGGGIYTKAADVGADLSGKNEYGLDEDDIRNPAVIADNVGDNVGDVAGMCADLFGSFAEATCAAMVLTARSPTLAGKWQYLCFPIIISSLGIATGLVTIILVRMILSTNTNAAIERNLKIAIGLSTVLQTPVVVMACYLWLPSGSFLLDTKDEHEHWWKVSLCIVSGLWTGLAIGYITEYYTSHSYKPVRQISEAQKTSAATGIIYGLALGYLSTVVPIFFLVITIIISITLCGMYGVAMAAIGMLSTLSISLTIDVFGPIADNAGGIVEMAELGEEIRERTDALDAAGNTTAAIGKGFAIGSAALVFLALFDAFTVTARIYIVDIMDPWTLPGAIYGAMHPFWFSALTMKSVGSAANDMVEECMRQFPKIIKNEMEPDYEKCIKIATKASLREMIWAAAIVIVSPIVAGTLLGKNFVAGMLIGILLCGILLAISMSNSGAAWDNSKKYITSGGLGPDHAKGSNTHKASVIGDTVGDPLKDTSGPSLNILVKFSAMLALIMAGVFADCSNNIGWPWWLPDSTKGMRVRPDYDCADCRVEHQPTEHRVVDGKWVFIR